MMQSMTDGLAIVESVFDVLYVNLERAQLEKKVKARYVDYCIDQVIEWAVTPICIDRVIWDKHQE